MKKLFITISCIFCAIMLSAQYGGNINLSSGNAKLHTPNIEYSYINNNSNHASKTSNFVSTDKSVMTIKGLANIKADNYVAIFNVNQTGEDTDEVNSLMDMRINKVIQAFKEHKDVEIFVDMISFVPMYEYELERKMFSKKTYSEIPAGFELQKNLHIRLTEPDVFNEVIAVCAESQIYDLVRVDYYCEKVKDIKKQLMAQAKQLIDEKTQFYKSMGNIVSGEYTIQIKDNFKVYVPIEQYYSYKVYKSSSIGKGRRLVINQADKNKTLYYQPLSNQGFDFVINNVIVEPVIQVVYEIEVTKTKVVKPEPKPAPVKVNKEYFYIPQDGIIRKLPIVQ